MTTANRKLKVFLCHSSGDKAVVRELYQKLCAERWIDPWLDEEKLLPGQDWDLEIQKAAEEADVVIVCVSSKSAPKEGYVQKEIRHVLDIALEKPEETIFIIPLRLEECELPRRLRAWQYVDYFPERRKPYVYQRLLRSLETRADIINTANIIQQKTDLKEDARVGTKHFPKVKDPEERDNLSSETSPIDFIRHHITTIGILLVVTLLVLVGLRVFINSPISDPDATPSAQPIEIPISSATVSSTLSFETPASETPEVVPDDNALGRDGMPLIYIPSGEFKMGSNGDFDEMPIHRVVLDSYWIDKTEATNKMYANCVNSKACKPPRANVSSTRNTNGEYYFGNPAYDDYPVIYVSWEDAKDYCQWVDRRLPTEAEWEKAASWDGNLQSNRKYPWGEEIDCSYANYRDGNTLCKGDTTPVGTYMSGASYYGVLDMAGNVSEWVWDKYDALYYSQDVLVKNPMGPPSGDFIVVRGGSFQTGEEIGNRSADRMMEEPDFASRDIGFRCAMDATP